MVTISVPFLVGAILTGWFAWSSFCAANGVYEKPKFRFFQFVGIWFATAGWSVLFLVCIASTFDPPQWTIAQPIPEVKP